MYGGTATGASPTPDNVLNEAQEVEQAVRLLDAASNPELDRFLGGLLKVAASNVGTQMTSALGRPLGMLLKGVAKQALPFAGHALGRLTTSLAAPGTDWETQAAALFGMEIEGLSPEDQEYQVARRFVRFGANAARNALAARRSMPPARAARTGVVTAARRHVPGLFRRRRPRYPAAIVGPRPFVYQPTTIVEPPIVDEPFDEPEPEPPAPDDVDDAVPTASGECASCAAKRTGWRRRGRDLIVTNVFPPFPEPTTDAPTPSA